MKLYCNPRDISSYQEIKIGDGGGYKFLIEEGPQKQFLKTFKNVDRTQKYFEYQDFLFKNNINVAKPLETGLISYGKEVLPYVITEFLDAQSMRALLRKNRGKHTQEVLGNILGSSLRKLHSIDYSCLNIPDYDHKKYYLYLCQRTVDRFLDSDFRFEGHEVYIEHIKNADRYLPDIDKVFLHGDLNDGNILIGNDLAPYLIDFNHFKNNGRAAAGYFYIDLRIAQGPLLQFFVKSMIDSYFDNELPKDFFAVANIFNAVFLLNLVGNYPKQKDSAKNLLKAHLVSSNYDLTKPPKWYTNPSPVLSTDYSVDSGTWYCFDHRDSWKIYYPYEGFRDKAMPRQGFKIHISTTLGAAQTTLSIASKILMAKGTAFKHLRNQYYLQKYNTSKGPINGKFMAIYPNNKKEFLELLKELEYGLRDMPEAQLIKSDLRYKQSNIYYRYGAFKGNYIVDNRGNKYKDIRGVGEFVLPSFVKIPDELRD